MTISFQRKDSSAKSGPAKSNKPDCLEAIQIEIQGSHSDLSDNELTVLHVPPGIITTPSVLTALKKKSISEGPRHISFDDSCKKESSESPKKMGFPQVSVIVEPPSPPVLTDEGRMQRMSEIRRHSSHTAASLTVKEFDKERDRRHSGHNPNLLGLDSEHLKFLNCSPAASRRISCGSLFKVGSQQGRQEFVHIAILPYLNPHSQPNETISLGKSKANLLGTSSADEEGKEEAAKAGHDKDDQAMKRLPIINPLVRLPTWPK